MHYAQKYLVSGIIVLFIIIVSIIGYVFWGFFETVHDINSKAENRKVLQEFISPDKTKKIGVYRYDEGGLSYLANNISIVRYNDEYPIYANLYTCGNNMISVIWLQNKSVLITIPEDNVNHNASNGVYRHIHYPYADIIIRIIQNKNAAPPNQRLKLTE